MALARLKSWNPGDTLTAADLNAEFNNILNNPITLISPTTGVINFNLQAHTNFVIENLAAAPAAATKGRVWFQTAAQSMAYDPGSSAPTVTLPFGPYSGNCRFQYVTSSAARLIPYQGNRIPIKSAGEWNLWPIPSTGIDIGTSFSNATSMNYVYCYNNAGALALLYQTSSFGHTASTETGVEVMTTDATRTLVGFVYTSTSGNLSTWGVNNLIASWYHPRAVSSQQAFTGDRAVATTSYSEVNSEIRVPFVVWATDVARVGVTGCYATASSINITYASIGFDGATSPEDCQFVANPSGPTGLFTAGIGITHQKTGLAEGYHFATVLGAVNVGTQSLTLRGATTPTQATPTLRTILNVSVTV